MKKSLEDLKSELVEVQAIRDLQDAEFCFDNKNIIKSEISYDAYLEIQEQDLVEAIEDYEYNNTKRKKKVRKK